MSSSTPTIIWFRSDLRLHDHAVIEAALATKQSIIPIYILDDLSPKDWKRGAASRWWLHQSLQKLDADLQKKGFHPLVYLKGDAAVELPKFAAETEASAVYWHRFYEPWAMARDTKIKEKLKQSNIAAHSFAGFLIFEPWEIKNKTGQHYKVFTPFSRGFLEYAPVRAPLAYKINPVKPTSAFKKLSLADLDLMPEIKWYQTMEKTWTPGEVGAMARLHAFSQDAVGQYKEQRDFPAIEGVSGLSPHLHFGEVSPHQIWHTVSTAIQKSADKKFENNAQGFLRQLIWREFSYHLLYHAPDFPEQPWNKKFENFPWRVDAKLLKLWQQGQTGYPIVDAGMRQLWQTGWMHNRVRMIVGSFLVKNLLIHWREGENWFWDTLVDADLGNNAAGWQWIAGCGADAAPYFRIFNPILQSAKFDGNGDYIKKYVPELKNVPPQYLHAPWEAPPMELKAAGVTLGKEYPHPIVDHAMARDRALAAYAECKGEVEDA